MLGLPAKPLVKKGESRSSRWLQVFVAIAVVALFSARRVAEIRIDP